MDSPFHLGEQQIQSRLGMRDKLEDIGRRMIRDHMPEQLREFLALLPWLLVMPFRTCNGALLVVTNWPPPLLLLNWTD